MLDRKTAASVVNDLAKSKTFVARGMIQGDRLILECLKNEPSNRPHRQTHVPIRNGMVSVRSVEQGLAAIDAHMPAATEDEPPTTNE